MTELARSFNTELAEMNQRLGTDFAIISKITGWDYEVLAVESKLDAVNQGDHFVTKDTYCNEVVETDSTVAYDHVGAMQSMVMHPIYTAMQLESYLGVPLHAGGQIVGTLNFSGFEPKVPEFSDEEIAAVKALAVEIEQSLRNV